MKYDIGDFVVIAPEVKISMTHYYSGGQFGPNPSMLKPKILFIRDIKYDYYVCNDSFYYAEEWLIPFKLEAGDKIKLLNRSALHSIQNFENGFSDEMNEWEDKVVTISKIIKNNYFPHHIGQDGNIYKIKEDDCFYSWESRAFDISYYSEQLKTKQNEDQLQRKDAVVCRGDRQESTGVCYRRNKATVTIGHLSYREISSR